MICSQTCRELQDTLIQTNNMYVLSLTGYPLIYQYVPHQAEQRHYMQQVLTRQEG